MKQRLLCVAVAMLALGLLAPVAMSQALATVKGVIIDQKGNPLNGGVVELVNKDNGRKYDLNTNPKGEFNSIAVAPGNYKVNILKENESLATFDAQVTLGTDNVLNFNLQKMQAEQKKGMTEEQKAQQKKYEEAVKENEKIRNLNGMLTEAANKQSAGDFDGAVATLKQATEADPSRDLLWFKLAEAERTAAAKTSDPNARTADYTDAVASYKKAIETSKNAKPETLGGYYNNMGEAYAKSGKSPEAISAYAQAVQADPTHAGQYYFNEGAILTNTGKVDEALQAFDKAIAADPNRAEAYYWKGVNLVGKATLKGNKMEAPPGTAEAFNKYLELQPNGPFADPAKQMLASIGAEVQTTYGKGKKKQ